MTTVRKAVITAAGRGTRLLPATRAVPKPLLPVLDSHGRCVPQIQVVIQEALSAGLDEVAVVVNPQDEPSFRRHFLEEPWDESHRALGERVRFLQQPTPEGFGDAVFQARDWIAGEPFLLLLSDQISRSHGPRTCAAQLLDAFAWRGVSTVGVSVMSGPEISRYGVVAGRALTGRPGAYDLRGIIEKPSVEEAARRLVTPGLEPGGHLCLFGSYAFTPTIFDVLDEAVREDRRSRGEIQLADAMGELLRREGLAALLIDGEWFDTGTPEGYRTAFSALAP